MANFAGCRIWHNIQTTSETLGYSRVLVLQDFEQTVLRLINESARSGGVECCVCVCGWGGGGELEVGGVKDLVDRRPRDVPNNSWHDDYLALPSRPGRPARPARSDQISTSAF